MVYLASIGMAQAQMTISEYNGWVNRITFFIFISMLAFILYVKIIKQ